jgi:4-hydroxy-2-oxoheptanedioate aldolase
MRHFTRLAKRILDSGADGIICPMINTAAEARQFVSYCRYALLGIRGYATTICRHTSYGYCREEHFRRVHEDLAIMVQIETREAVDNTAAIAAKDGVNVVFIGPMDLSKSLGFPGEVTHPVVQDALRQAEETIRKSGKIMGTMLVPGFELGALIERRYDFIITGADIGILRSGMENQVKGLLEAAKKSGRR